MTDQSSVPADAPRTPPTGEPSSQSAVSESIPGRGPAQQDTDGPGGPFGQGPATGGSPPAVPRKRSRALLATAIGASYAVLAAGAAAAVVTTGSPVAVIAAAQPTPSPDTSASASPSASATTAPPSPSPSPTPTVTGQVNGATHTGDLRYFLLPPPGGASSVQGDPDGDSENLSAVLVGYGNSASAKSFLRQLDFKGGATRTYQDSTLGGNVVIELLQFGSSGEASEWQQGFQLNGGGWSSFSVAGESGASAWDKSSADGDTLIGSYYAGDTFYEITLYGTQTLPHTDLADLMKAEHGRLSHG